MGRLASQRRGQPDRQENGRHRGGYRRLQEGQRPYVTQQAAMVGDGGQQYLMGRLASQRRGQPDRQENGRHRGGYRRLQEGQRPYVTQQAAMVGRMVRFFLGGQRKGLAQQCQTYQQEDKQRSPGKPTVATHTDSMVARSHGLSLPEMLGPPVEAGKWRAGQDRK